MDPNAVRDVAGLAVICLFALGGFTVWLLKDYIGDLKKQRDVQVELTRSGQAVTARIADRVDDLFAALERGAK